MIKEQESITGTITGTISVNAVVNNGVVVPDEIDPTVPSYVKEITQEDITRWNKEPDLTNYYTKGEIENKEYLTKEDIEDLEITPNNYIAGENIEIKDNVISVQTAPNVEQDNTKPITSAAVYTEVGNINILLQTI